MQQQIYQPADLRDLRDLRASAAELARYREEARELLEGVAERGDVSAAREVLREAGLKTRELTQQINEQGSKLGPVGVFLSKYGVHVINDHTILFALPTGCSRIEVIQEALGLVEQRIVIDPQRLEAWMKDDGFARKIGAAERICIDGHVRGGDAKNRETQIDFLRRKGFELPSQEDLAVAFALYWVATGKPLFGFYEDRAGRIQDFTYEVRSATGSLYFEQNGLGAVARSNDDDSSDVAVSARIFPETE